MIAKQEQVNATYFTQGRLLIEVGLTQGANVTSGSIAEHAIELSVRTESMRRIHDLLVGTRISRKHLDQSDKLQCWWDLGKSSRIQA